MMCPIPSYWEVFSYHRTGPYLRTGLQGVAGDAIGSREMVAAPRGEVEGGFTKVPKNECQGFLILSGMFSMCPIYSLNARKKKLCENTLNGIMSDSYLGIWSPNPAVDLTSQAQGVISVWNFLDFQMDKEPSAAVQCSAVQCSAVQCSAVQWMEGTFDIVSIEQGCRKKQYPWYPGWKTICSPFIQKMKQLFF
jgi:hypothetical protein